MQVNWKAIIFDLVLEILLELAPGRLAMLATVAGGTVVLGDQ